MKFAFQSTLPARGATAAKGRDGIDIAISIHAPRTGSDFITAELIDEVLISIHAPRTGSDHMRRN